MTTLESKSFLRGYVAGLHGDVWSAREVMEGYPEYDTKCIGLFLNGNDDGLHRDSFRITTIEGAM